MCVCVLACMRVCVYMGGGGGGLKPSGSLPDVIRANDKLG